MLFCFYIAFLLYTQVVQWQKTNTQTKTYQGTKKLVSDSPGLVDFAVGLVDFTLNLPKGQVKALGEIFLEEIRQAGKLNFFVPCIF